jgi:AcrR family transcriptional regulator
MNEESARPYHSPLREEQARKTRDLILDALIELLADRRADDITTREIAERAGVSQPTVYRHFPDRTALLEGITARGNELASRVRGWLCPREHRRDRPAHRVAVRSVRPIRRRDARRGAAQRRPSPLRRRYPTALRGDARRGAADFPDLDERQHVQFAGILRCLGSSQSWLRMREEFGVPGVEAGPLLRWAVDTLIEAVRNGELPEIDPAPHTDHEG